MSRRNAIAIQALADSAPPLGQSLTSLTMKGMGWVFAGKLAARLIAFLNVVILARLLSPDQFGVFGFVTLAICSLDTVSQIGFDAALIHRRDDSDGTFNTAWTVQAIRGLLLALLLSLAAPLVARFFGEPRIVLMLRVLSISLALQGMANIGLAAPTVARRRGEHKSMNGET